MGLDGQNRSPRWALQGFDEQTLMAFNDQDR
jgi:hypothetical protein